MCMCKFSRILVIDEETSSIKQMIINNRGELLNDIDEDLDYQLELLVEALGRLMNKMEKDFVVSQDGVVTKSFSKLLELVQQ